MTERAYCDQTHQCGGCGRARTSVLHPTNGIIFWCEGCWRYTKLDRWFAIST